MRLVPVWRRGLGTRCRCVHVLSVSRGVLAAIADIISFWVKHKAELEQPRGRDLCFMVPYKTLTVAPFTWL